MKLFYEIETGLWWVQDNDCSPRRVLCKGSWAGNGKGKNDKLYCNTKCVGPLPVGRYTMLPPVLHATLGPFAIRLVPDEGNRMYGRCDFWIHGPSKDPKKYGQESMGCIIAARPNREKIWELGVISFEVI